MNAYEQKQEAKRERLEAAADRAREKSNIHYKRADLREEVSGIPFGQPILVGHHSEGRHRAAIKRADNAMRASIEADKRAGELSARAEAVGTGGISSDDPEAIQKLQAQIDSAQAVQDYMKSANKIIKAAVKKSVNVDTANFAPYLAALQALPNGGKVTATAAADMLKPDFAGRIGFAAYQTSNNLANIKRMEKRVAQLRADHAAAEASGGENKTTSYQGVCDLVENFDENRLQIVFDGKPSAEVRAEIKSNGFRWSPSQGAWQRQLNNGARYAATRFLRSQGVDA